jgi:RNA polymerase sigma factor (sigma-70 family)
MSSGSAADSPTAHGVFVTTRWTMVLVAAGGGEVAPARAAAALDQLCQAYWRPLYVFARRQGMAPAEAEDATQGYFARLLARQDIAQADPKRGRFRTFLLTSFKNYLANQRRDAARLKRGGGDTPLSLDWAEAETAAQGALASGITPDKLFDRQWAEEVLELAARRLRERYAAAGKGAQAESLEPFLWAGPEALDGENLAQRLGMSPGGARVALHRARSLFRELVREEIAQTVQKPEDVDEELRGLIEVLRGD